MFKTIRIAVLLYLLLFVAVGQWLTARNSTAWHNPLWVDVYPVNGDASEAAERSLERLAVEDFAAIEAFFMREAERFGIALERPIRFALAPQLDEPLPPIPDAGSIPNAILWSLRMRWLSVRLAWQSDRPSADIKLFVAFHDADADSVLERSGALRKGMVAIANVFAERHAEPTNQVIIAHELLHTLGATDKYDPRTNMPYFPQGYAEPRNEPLLPQSRAEIMAGRIAVSRTEARIPRSLYETVIGEATALEIRWLSRL